MRASLWDQLEYDRPHSTFVSCGIKDIIPLLIPSELLSGPLGVTFYSASFLLLLANSNIFILVQSLRNVFSSDRACLPTKRSPYLSLLTPSGGRRLPTLASVILSPAQSRKSNLRLVLITRKRPILNPMISVSLYIHLYEPRSDMPGCSFLQPWIRSDHRPSSPNSCVARWWIPAARTRQPRTHAQMPKPPRMAKPQRPVLNLVV